MYYSYEATAQILEDDDLLSKSSWIVLGKIASSVSHYEIWRGTFKNLSEWVKHFARKIKKSPSVIWRYISSYKYYLSLPEKFHRFDCIVKSRDIESLPLHVTAENLELLLKIERVADNTVMQSLYEKTLNGSITRALLREQWDIYKEGLDGKTARGKNVKPPELSDTKKTVGFLMKLLIHRSLLDNTEQLLSSLKCESYKIFRDFDVTMTTSDNQSVLLHFDAIVVAKYKTYIKIHGLIFMTNKSVLNRQWISDIKQYVDFSWLVTISAVNFDLEDSNTGILVIDDEDVSDYKTAVDNNISHSIVADHILFNML
jgi:hypothetical protein